MTEHLKSISKQPPSKPAAILVVSAHWEEGEELAVTSSERPEMLYDYFGFADEVSLMRTMSTPYHARDYELLDVRTACPLVLPQFYKLSYPAPGNPALATRIQSLLAASDLPTRLDAQRGLDHGVCNPRSREVEPRKTHHSLAFIALTPAFGHCILLARQSSRCSLPIQTPAFLSLHSPCTHRSMHESTCQSARRCRP